MTSHDSKGGQWLHPREVIHSTKAIVSRSVPVAANLRAGFPPLAGCWLWLARWAWRRTSEPAFVVGSVARHTRQGLSLSKHPAHRQGTAHTALDRVAAPPVPAPRPVIALAAFLAACLAAFVMACTGGFAGGPLARERGAAAGQVGSAAATETPAPTPAPPTPTPTPVPEPRDFAIAAEAGGGWFFAEPGFAVQDEAGGPRFWTAFQQQGGLAALGLPASRPFDAPDGRRVQLFERGWLAGVPGQPGVQRGDGPPPQPPAEALARQARPQMAFIGRVDISPREARQGATVVLRVWAPAAQQVAAAIEGRNLPLARQGDAFVGLYGFHRLARLGPRPVRFTLTDATGRQTVRNDPADTIRVIDGGYATENIDLPPSSLSLLDPAEVNKEEALLNSIYSRWTPERLWHGAFSAPVADAEITSEFGTRRSYNRGPVTDAHEGVDYGVQTGDPIHAAADGKVVFAGPLHVRGNTVIIDHGWGVMTGYFHQSVLHVQEGQLVHQGDVIGEAGATGFVTGPHLHFEVRVQNVNVEPLEWLNAPSNPRPDLLALASGS